MILFAEILRAISISVLVICSSFYFRYLDKTRKQRKLSTFEFAMYLTIQGAFLLFAVSLLIFYIF
ncbi:hypothetical protein D8M05_13300 [Oceanobacillus bengalensis]|uniref:DUF4181 domain-containing protein n=1 Tax=Oceanobacillus bengalensis TaxID=1435466 RepID=A0A494YW40_9BACI|nr:hypothetical protein D8M05_13300 [Oceanobacillus bengalensis]